jgi:serine/threonine protein kinase
MFVQMCEAVALCHDVGVSHRDIKPENFICCDSQELSALPHDGEAGFYDKRKVVVKLTDFGLATSEERNTDVECGSRPYMAFECRNNLGPDYAPGPADIWSLGIVLINMLFHRQPWADPVQGDANFDDFLGSPTEFLLNKFTGIGREVATYLAERVFCLHVEHRVDARELGAWAKDLPTMIGGRKAVSALKASRLNDDSDGREPLRFTKTAYPPRDNQSQLTSSTLTKSAPTPSGSQEPSVREAEQIMDEVQVSTPEQLVVEDEEIVQAFTPCSPEQADADADDHEGSIRSASVGKRKKRGTRKGKAAQAAASAILAGLSTPPPGERDVLLAELAEASQSLAREMSKTVIQKEPEIDMFEFPRLGEELPVIKSKTSKLNSFLTSKNPELQALARKVQEREGSRGNYSAPAQLQHGNSATSSMRSGTSSMTSSGSQQGQTKSHHGSTGQQRIMTVETWRRPTDATTSLPSEVSRGRDWRHADSARDERSPLSGGVSRPASSTFTGSSIYSGHSSNDS